MNLIKHCALNDDVFVDKRYIVFLNLLFLRLNLAEVKKCRNRICLRKIVFYDLSLRYLSVSISVQLFNFLFKLVLLFS